MFDHSECVTKRHCLMLCLTRSHLNIFPCVVLNPRVILMQATFTYIRNYINWESGGVILTNILHVEGIGKVG